MAKVIMTSSAFATALSEEVGERSGLTIDRGALVRHLGAHSVFGDAFVTEDRLLRIDWADYSDAIGHLLFALGTIEQPDMPSLGTRLIDRLGRGAALTMDIDRLLSVEAIANHALRERQRSGTFDRKFLVDEVHGVMGAFAQQVMDALEEVMPYHLAFSPIFTREMDVKSQIDLEGLFESERLPTDGAFFDQRFVNYLAANPAMLVAIQWRQFEGWQPSG